jgi:GTPase SAR1 family protein
MEIKALDHQKVIDKGPLPTRSNWGIFGRKGSGKTSMILNIIMKKDSPWYKKFNLIFLISPTALKDDKIKELIDDIGDNQYFQDLSDETLESIKQQITADTEQRGKKGDYLIIYDDVIHMLKGKSKSKTVDEIATQNRHWGITNVYLLQKYTAYLTPLIRSNLDLISFFQTPNKKEQKSFFEEMNEDDDVMKALYDYATDGDYSFLHINNYGSKPKYYKNLNDEIKYIV